MVTCGRTGLQTQVCRALSLPGQCEAQCGQLAHLLPEALASPCSMHAEARAPRLLSALLGSPSIPCAPPSLWGRSTWASGVLTHSTLYSGSFLHIFLPASALLEGKAREPCTAVSPRLGPAQGLPQGVPVNIC